MNTSMSRASLACLASGAAWVSARSRRQAWLLAFTLGALLPLAFAPFYILPVMLVAFTGLVWLIDSAQGPRAAMSIGWWFGFGQFLTGLLWIANAFSVRDGVTYGEGLAAVVLLAAGLAVFPALAALAARRFWVAGDYRILILTLAWSVMEWLRGHILTGFPWNLAGHALGFHPAAMQLAAYGGIYSLGLIMVLIAAAPAAMVDADGVSPRWRPLVAAAAGFALLLGFGFLRLALNPTNMVADTALVIVQANIPQERKWDDNRLRDHFHRHIEMSRQALEGVRAARALVIWPETAIALDPGREFTTRYLISKALDRPGIVITGAPRHGRDDQGVFQAWNSLYAVDHNGRLQGRYDKAHLVPFGEYVPLRPLLDRLAIGRLVPAGIDFSAGPGAVTLSPPDVPPFSPLICYEAIFPGTVIAPGAAPQWLLNISNDAWFGESHGPQQHFAIARLRAIEEGIPLVRATNTGISAIVDPLGRVLYALGQSKTGVIVGKLPQALHRITIYRLWRDWTYIAMLLVIGGLFMRHWLMVKNRYC